MASPSVLWDMVQSGKVSKDQLNDEGKKALLKYGVDNGYVKREQLNDEGMKLIQGNVSVDQEQARTPVSAVKNIAGVPFGVDILPTYKEDSGLAKIGKGIVNYGLGTAGRAINSAYELPANIINTITSPGREREYITTPAQVFPRSGQDKIEQFKETNPVLGNIAEYALYDALNPLTYVSGGIAGELAKATKPAAGTMLKATALDGPIKNLLAQAKKEMPDAPIGEIQNIVETRLAKEYGLDYNNLNVKQKQKIKELVEKNTAEGSPYVADEFGNVQTKPVSGELPIGTAITEPTVNPPKTFTRSQTPLQEAERALQEGVEVAQNFVKHDDVLAAYPPGTSIEAAFADIQKNTGVDLYKLVDDYEQLQKVQTTPIKELPRAGAEEMKLANVAGVREIPKPARSIDPATNQAYFRRNEPIPDPLEFRKTVYLKPESQNMPNASNIQGVPKIDIKNDLQIPPTKGANEAGNGIVPMGKEVAGNEVESLLPPKFELSLEDLQSGKLPKVQSVKQQPQSPGTSRSMAAIIEDQADEIDIPRQREPMGDGPGTAESFREKVDRNPKKKGSFVDFLKNLRTQFVDDLAPLEKLEKNVRGKVSSAEDSLYKQGRLFKGAPTKANEIVRTQLAPIIKSVTQKGKSYKDLGDYALAVHAKDVNAKGINSGFTNAEIDDVIAKLGSAEMEAARQQLVKVSDNMINELANAGVISKESLAAMREKYPNYMPLFRSFEDEKVDFAKGLSNALANVSSPIKALKGSSRDVVDPIESMVKNIFQITNAAERNKVAKQLGKLAQDDIEKNFIRKLGPSEDVGRKNVVSVMEDGKKIQYEVADPEVYKAILNLDKESTDFLIVKILSKPAAVLRAGATLTPEFSLRNPMRDVAQAFVVSKSGFNPVTDFPIGLAQSIFKGRTIRIAGKEIKTPGELYNQFLMDNGGFGNIVSMDRKIHKEAIEEAIKKPISGKLITILNPIGLLRKIADVSETATKLGEYRAALRSGTSRPEAAYRARDLMDFSRAGYSGRSINKGVAFFNANIQGKSKIIRAIKENPTKVAVRGIMAITVPTVGVYLSQKYLANDTQKRVIDDAPNWQKASFWLIPVPGTDQVARIPKPFDLAPVFANLPERMLDYIDKNDPEAFDKFAKETFSNWSIPVMITGIMPLLEGTANYSWFKQGSIIPERERSINYPDQYDINTTEAAKAIGKGVNKITQGEGPFKNLGSPRVIDSVIQGTTAGLGKYATDAVDVLLNKSGAVNNPVKPEKSPAQLPLARAFLVNQASTGQSVDDLYSLQEKLTKEKGSAKLNKETFKQVGQLQIVSSATGKIGDISKTMRAITNSEKLSAKEKRERLDSLNKKRNEIAIKAMERLRGYQKNK